MHPFPTAEEMEKTPQRSSRGGKKPQMDVSVDSNNIGWSHGELTTLALHLAEGQSCADRQATSVDLFAQTHTQIWHKSAKRSLHGLGGRKKVFSLNDKSLQLSPVTWLVPMCCRDGRFTSRMFVSAQDKIFCNTICSSVDAIPSQHQELCRAPAEPAEPLYSRQDSKNMVLVSPYY